VTEFLPISSSGHLVLFQGLFGLKEPQLSFDIALHGGTLAAVVLVYWSDLVVLVQDVIAYLSDRIRRESGPAFFQRPSCRLALWIVVGTIITGGVGLCLEDRIEPLFASPLAVGVALLVTGTVLWMTSYVPGSGRDVATMTMGDAIWVGLAQGAALIPGISRSGVTISAGLFRGLDREMCARFSFLMMIPATIGAIGLKGVSPASHASLSSLVVLLGTVIAFLTGYVSLRFLLNLIQRGRFYGFAYYCWGVGALSVILSL